MQVRPGHEWDKFEGLAIAAATSCRRFSTPCRSRAADAAAARRPRSRFRSAAGARSQPDMSTQAGFGASSTSSPSDDGAVRRAHRHHLAGRHGLDQSRRLGQPAQPVRPRSDGRRLSGASGSPRPSTGTFSPRGQHIELGIAEMNLFLLLSALGLSHDSSASGCCRSARSTIRSSPAASMR